MVKAHARRQRKIVPIRFGLVSTPYAGSVFCDITTLNVADFLAFYP